MRAQIHTLIGTSFVASSYRYENKEYPEEYTIIHFAGGAMLKYFTSTFSSSCSVPIWISIFGTKKQQKQNNQFISNQLSQTNIVLSKINFKCELLCSYCLHNYIRLAELVRNKLVVLFLLFFGSENRCPDRDGAGTGEG